VSDDSARLPIVRETSIVPGSFGSQFRKMSDIVNDCSGRLWLTGFGGAGGSSVCVSLLSVSAITGTVPIVNCRGGMGASSASNRVSTA
jgi:hypothetical protein